MIDFAGRSDSKKKNNETSQFIDFAGNYDFKQNYSSLNSRLSNIGENYKNDIDKYNSKVAENDNAWKNSDYYNDYQSQFTNNRKQITILKQDLERYSEQYKKALGEKKYQELTEYVSSVDSSYIEFDNSINQKRKYYSQWEDEESYNRDYENYTYTNKYKGYSYSDLLKAKADVETQLANDKENKDLNGELSWLNVHKTDKQFADTMTNDELIQYKEDFENKVKSLKDTIRNLNTEKLAHERGGQTYNARYQTVIKELESAEKELATLENNNGGVLYYDEAGAVTTDTLLKMRENESILSKINSDEKTKTAYEKAIEASKQIQTIDNKIMSEKIPSRDLTTEKQSRQAIIDEFEALGYDFDSLKHYEEWKTDRDNYAQTQAENMKYASEHPVLATVESILTAPFTLFELVDNMSDAKRYGLSNIYDDKIGMQNETYQSAVAKLIEDAVYNKTDSEVLSWLASTAYSGVTSASQSALTTAACTVMFGGAGANVALAVMGTEAAASSYRTAISNGSSNEQAILTSVTAGVGEALFEKIPLDNLLRLGKNASKETLVGVLKSIAKQGFLEGLEEGGTEIWNTLADGLINGDRSAYNTSIRQYELQGYSIEEAVKKANNDWLNDLLSSVVGGFAGGISTGGVTGTGYVLGKAQENQNVKNTGRLISATDGVSDLLTNAKGLEGLSEKETKTINKLTNKIDGKTNSNEHISSKDARYIGKLYNLVSEKQTENTRNLVKEELKAHNADTSDKTIDVLLKYAQGEKLTEAEQTVFDENKGAYVLDNIVYKMAQKSSKPTTETVNGVNADTFEGTTENAVENDFKQTTYNGEAISFKYKSADAVELNNGKTVSVEDITMSDDDAVFYDAIMGENDIFPEARFVNGKLTSGVNISTANEIRKIFGGTPTINQLIGVQLYYRYGMYNIKRFGESGALTAAQEKQVFNLGRALGKDIVEKESSTPKVKKYSKGKVKYNVKSELNSRQQASVEVIEKLADMFNITFNLYESTLNENGERLSVMPNGEKTSANGYYMNGEIYVDINAGNNGQGAVLYTVAHELTHYIREWSPKKFKVLADFLVEQYESRNYRVDDFVERQQQKYENTQKYIEKAVNKQIEKARKSGYRMKYSEAFEEFVADSMEKMLTDQNAVEKLAMLRTKDKSVFDKLREGIQKLVDRIKQEYAKLTPDSAEGRTVATMIDVFSDIQDLFLEALDDASNNFQKAEKNTITNDGVKESKRLGGYFPKIEVSTNDISIFNIDDINDLKEVKEKTFNYLLGKYVSNDKISKPIKNIDTDMEIYVYRGGINETFGKAKAYKNLSNKKKKIKLATMTSLAKLIKYGEVRSEDASNYHNVNSGSVFAYLTAPISVDGVNYTVNMDIKKTPDGNRFYIHTIKIADEAPMSNNSSTKLKTSSANSSVPQENTTVNNNSMQENENNSKVKFSERGQSVYKLLGENQRLQKENARLKEKVKYLNDFVKLQRKITHGKIIDRRSTEAQARKLKKSTGSKIELSNLTDQLYAFYTLIIGSEDLVWDTVLTRASWIANDILNEVPESNQRDEYAQEILSYVRSKNIRLNDVQRAEVENIYDSYNAYRKRLMGSITISQKGTSLDSVWQDLAEQYPDTFSKDTNPADMPLELADIIHTLRNSYEVIEEFDKTEQVRWLAEQIYDTYWDVSTVESVMDKLSKEQQQQINELKMQHAERVKKIYTKHQEDLNNQRAYYQEMYKRLRERATASHKKQMLDYQDKVHEAQAKAIEKRNNTETRRQILKTLDKIDARLSHPTKEKNIGLEMQPLACRLLTLANLDTVDADYRIERLNTEMENTTNPQVLNTLQTRIDNITKQGEKKAAELQQKRNKYKAIAADAQKSLQQMGKTVEIDEVIDKTLKDIEALVGGTPIRRMTSYQLECLKNAVNMVDGYIRADKQLFIDGKKQNYENVAQTVIHEVLGNSKKEKQFIKQLEWLNKFGWSMLKPETAFDLIGSSALSHLFQEARKGDDKFARSVSAAQIFLSENVKKYGADKWNMEERKEFMIQDEKVTLTLGEILSLYAYSKRDQAIPHLESGGFVQVEPVKKKIGGKINIEYTVYEDHAHRISEVELGSIINILTKEQIAFADVMQEYLSTVMGAKGNEISRELYQIDLFKEKFYFPLKLSSVYKYFKKNENSKTPVLKNAGMTKPTVTNANDPIVLESFENVWANHVVQMSRYNAYVLGIENLTKVFGYTGIDKSSVRAALQGTYGDAAIKYLENFIIDLNGGRKGMSHGDMVNVASKLLSTFKKVTVSASLSTAIQQPSSVIRAMSYVKPKYFLMRKNEKISHKDNWEELKKYAPIATLKEIGGYDMSSGINVADFIKQRDYKGKEKLTAFFKDSNYRDEILMWGASKGDELAWSTLWHAIKKEQRYRFPNMEKEKFLKICGQRFTDVATKTQVYDSVFTRSEIMRSPSETNKMATSFMGEPMTNLNIIIDSVIQAKRGKITRPQMRWNIGCVFASQILAAGLASTIYAMRDDDEDESFWEKYVQAFSNKTFDEVLFGLLIPINSIPYIRDIYSMMSGYDVVRTDMSVFSNLIESFKNLDSKSMSDWDKISGVIGSFAAAFGLPLKNLLRDGKAIYNLGVNIFDDNVAQKGDTAKAFAEGIFGEKKMAEANEYLSKDKTEKANKIINDLLEEKTEKNISNGKTPEKAEKNAKSSIRSSLTSYWKPLFIEAYQEDDYIEQEEIYERLLSTGIYGTSGELKETIEKWVKDLQ